jgi:hypothetical protein
VGRGPPGRGLRRTAPPTAYVQAGTNVGNATGTNVYSMAWLVGLVAATVPQEASAGSTDNLTQLEPTWPVVWHPGSAHACPLIAPDAGEVPGGPGPLSTTPARSRSRAARRDWRQPAK